MKNKPLILLIFFIFYGSSIGLAEPLHKPPHPNHERIKERLVTLRNWKLMETFNLSGERANRVFNILAKFDDKRENLILKRRRLYKTLRDELRMARPSEKVLRNLIREITGLNIELAKLHREEVKALSPVFTVEEQARYLLFSERFAKEVRRFLMRPAPRMNDQGLRKRLQR